MVNLSHIHLIPFQTDATPIHFLLTLKAPKLIGPQYQSPQSSP